MVRTKDDDENPKEVLAQTRRIAHKKQRPPEMTLAEFHQFQFDIEMEELDEWIIDDEVYSEAMDVAPIDQLEELEQSLAQMTRHSHRERRHHRNGTQTAHRKTKRRKPRSPVVREDIGPVRTRYDRHHHNNNNNTNDEHAELIDLADEGCEESLEPKYNLRRRRPPKELPGDFIELCTEDMGTEKKEQEPDTDLITTVVNDGCHVDRRTLVSPSKIIKATELNLPVAMFEDKPGDYDNYDGLSEDEVAEEKEHIHHNFISDMDVNYIQSEIIVPRESKKDGTAKPLPQFTLEDIAYNDDDTEKVMPIEDATDLPTVSVNNVSVNNESPSVPEPPVDPTPAPKSPLKPQPSAGPAQKPRKPKRATAVKSKPVKKPLKPQPSNDSVSAQKLSILQLPVDSVPSPSPTQKPQSPTDSTSALKPFSKPQLPVPSAKKTPVIATATAKYLLIPAIEKPPSKGTKIKELEPSSNNEPLSSAKSKVLSNIKQKQVPQPDATSTEELNGEPKAIESNGKHTNGPTAPKRRSLGGRRGKEKLTALSKKLNTSDSAQASSESNEKKAVASNAKLIVNDSSQNVIQSTVIDAQKLSKVSFKKKPVVEPASEPVTQTSEPIVDNNNNYVSAPSLNVAPDTVSNNTTLESNTVDQSASKMIPPDTTANVPQEAKPMDTAPPVPSGENEAPRDPISNSQDRHEFVGDKIAAAFHLNTDGYQQHGSYAPEEADFDDGELITNHTTEQPQQHNDSSERYVNERNTSYDYEEGQYSYDNGREQYYNSYQPNNERQFRHKDYYDRRPNYYTARGHDGYNQHRGDSYDRPQHYNGFNSRGGSYSQRGYDNAMRPFRFNNRRGYRPYHNNGYGGYNNRPYDRPMHPDYYPRQYDNRSNYTDQFAVQSAPNGPIMSYLPLPIPVPVQQAVPAQVMAQQVVQQVVSVQHVPVVTSVVAPTVEPEPENTEDDYFLRKRKKHNKTPEPETSTSVKTEPRPMAAIKPGVALVPIKPEVAPAITQPEPPRVEPQVPPPPSFPPHSAPTTLPETDVRPQPRESTEPSVGKKRSRSRSPSEERAQKRQKVLNDVLERRHAKDRTSDKDKERDKEKHKDKERDREKERDKDKRRDKEKEKHKDKHRKKDKHKEKERHKHKDKHESRRKDKHRHRDNRDEDQHQEKEDERPSPAPRESEQTNEKAFEPQRSFAAVTLKKVFKSDVTLGDGTKPRVKSNLVAKAKNETSPAATPVKKKRLASTVSVPKPM
eukprot:TRINITY_DN3591_c0_g1_i1.p1 TRINITY_DN3591_c0_g1~~TRINITY_DN3591_c0_g1_i1.p1  ORF type:complete len:1239 (+),score=242.35 TRINITY_DN3591_c0_g1_i1:107-3823(+)